MPLSSLKGALKLAKGKGYYTAKCHWTAKYDVRLILVKRNASQGVQNVILGLKVALRRKYALNIPNPKCQYVVKLTLKTT